MRGPLWLRIAAALPFALASTAGAKTVTVHITDLAFAPAEFSVAAGDVVEWINEDFIAHTATDKEATFDVEIAPGEKGSTTLKSAGPISYYCRYHPNMTGRITPAQ